MNLKYKLTSSVYDSKKHKYKDLSSLFVAMWKNTSIHGGLALTVTGFECLADTLDLAHWTISIDEKDITTSGDLLMLERYMTVPFYFHYRLKQKSKLVVFDESVAAQLILYGNNLKLFLQSHDSASNNPIKK